MGDYRSEACAALARADEELASHDGGRLRYAALELRMAMEALTYDRATAYEDEFPIAEYETWQPKKVMRVLLDVDPHADANSTVRVGAEPVAGLRPETMRTVGSETVLGMAAIKGSYDALGSYLHVPTLKQRRKGAAPDTDGMRARLMATAETVRQALSSPVRNVTLGEFWTFPCNECDQPIRRRRSGDRTAVTVTCHGCGTGYALTDLGEGRPTFVQQGESVACANAECGRRVFVSSHEAQVGRGWTCLDCGGTNEFRLCVVHGPAPAQASEDGRDHDGRRG